MKLRATGAFSAVDFFNTLDGDTPTAQRLAQYDAILVWPFSKDQNDDILHNLLIGYFKGGGRIVVAEAAIFQHQPGPFQNYMLVYFNGDTWVSSKEGMGAVLEPDSSLMAGVARVDFKIEAVRGADVRGDAQVVARWKSGPPFVVRGKIGGRTRVDLNFPAISSDADDQNGWMGDGAILIKNALLYE